MGQDTPLTALGLMSGTSRDGIDAAIISTDGHRVYSLGAWVTVPYGEEVRRRLRAGDPEVERDLTLLHAQTVKTLLAHCKTRPDVIGFHGHTIEHRPHQGVTRQLGDGALLAQETGITVVNDFRSRDVAQGGEGAPLAPLYHAALALDLEKPLAVLNVGGVANITWLGEGEADILAFDTGPGNALLDDWVLKATGSPMDEDGKLALSGRVDQGALATLSAHPYFERIPPKSLDRDEFNPVPVAGLSPADGAATLTAFTAEAVARSVKFLPHPPQRWLVCGGGRLNPALIAALNKALGASVDPVDSVGWQGDALEAQAFAFLAVRSLKGLPLSLPGTTGVSEPTTGGVAHGV